jgi:translation initiation factor 5B
MALRQPIVTVCGHVDHGKTSILDCFRGSDLQADEAGGITQKISFTKYTYDRILRACPLVEKSGIKLDIPGFLFIDTPGHAAFTNLRKRGGALADLAIVVVSIKEGIKPQTAEVLQILRHNKTPFLIALNKVDAISGWRKDEDMKTSIERQPTHARDEFDEALLTFQGNLKEHGFDSALYYEVTDFTKEAAIVPCSARSGEGISELLFVLCGLCQRFLKKRLEIGETAKGVILEVKKERGMESVEAILYDGKLKEGSQILVASFGEPVETKVRALAEIVPLSTKYSSVKDASAATGVRMQLTNKEGIVPGMQFQEVGRDMESVKEQFKKDVSTVMQLDKQGIIITADSLGSLEALITLLRQANIQILNAGIGPISKHDVLSAKANLDINKLDAVVVGFNVDVDTDVEVPAHVKILKNDVVYRLIEDLTKWRTERQAELDRERMMDLATVCKIEILPQFVFRNSNPAIFGVRVVAGKVRVGLPLIDENGEDVARVKSLQVDKSSVEQAEEGKELALALPGLAFDRHLKMKKFLYANVSENQIKLFKKNKDLLSRNEMQVLQEIIQIKQKTQAGWGE